ncbi:alanine/ornithine racemase family PLP-dependent enzyme [Geobacillus thermodenitrificans]|uniref:alanine/ornithine racemase family PLP-dependent enzyme n=1 Tax=Geobacillus thermodenitrificans TaxID=33940 RepID=UPI0035B56AAB
MDRYPRVTWDEKKLIHNARVLNAICKHHVEWIPVTKSVGANIEIVDSLYKQGYRKFADSRLQNLKAIKKYDSSINTCLLRIPGIHEIKDVITWADCSLVSEYKVIEALNQEALSQGKIHHIILMIELGDLREGIMPEELMDIGKHILKFPAIHWLGIGTNLTCFGGVLPTSDKLAQLVQLKESVEKKLGYHLSVISGGNSSSLHLLMSGEMPREINHLRLGESLFFGRETAFSKQIPGMHHDIFLLEAEVIEIKDKPSYPQGIIVKNAFGETPHFTDKGIRRRAILALGEQDVPLSELTPVKNGIEIIGGSSDHAILDVTEHHDQIQVGSILSFQMSYKALLHAMTSNYIYKKKINSVYEPLISSDQSFE